QAEQADLGARKEGKRNVLDDLALGRDDLGYADHGVDVLHGRLSLLLVMAEPLPTVRTMGPSPVICRHPGESRDPVSGSFDIHVLVPLGSCRAGCFPFWESSQNHCVGHDGFNNVILPKLPAVLAERRSRRTRTSVCSNM